MTQKFAIVNESITVEYPHGAGGMFLSSVLACCTMNLPWTARTTSWHGTSYMTNLNHWYEPANNVISIDDPAARFNFWIYYFKKRVAHDLIYYRYHRRRWIKCPYAELDTVSDGFWLLNQCRFIIHYQSQQPWKLNWAQMLENPEASWKIIQDFLDANNQQNHWNLLQWQDAVQSYRKTLSRKVSINVHHVRWQIWATALLQEQGILADFDIIHNFRNQLFLEWLDKHNPCLIKITQKHMKSLS